MNFWTRLPKRFFALAPMEDVTDTVFREIVELTATPGKLHVVFTEFMSVDGFLHEVGKENVKLRLFISDQERELLHSKGIKIVAQIWGSDPEKFYKTSQQIAEHYTFDGIDINMGCPVKKIIKNNACSALIKAPELAREIIIATKEGAGLPVSVKTRIGFNEVETERWIENLLEVNPAAITVHGRIQKMQSNGWANWSEILKAVQLRNRLNSSTRIVGNGDVVSYEDGLARSEKFQTDGIMAGRGIFSNPSFFSDQSQFEPKQNIQLLKHHLQRFNEEWSGKKNYAILKRFFKIYLHSFENATALRAALMESQNCNEGIGTLEAFEKTAQLYSA